LTSTSTRLWTRATSSNSAFYRGRIGDIGGDGRRARQPSGGRVGEVAIDVGDDDHCAARGELARDCGAETTARTGHDGDAPVHPPLLPHARARRSARAALASAR
jgi:hypothetical protein